MTTPRSPERGETPPPSSLEYVLRRHEDELTLLAEPGKPLTRERLSAIAPHLLEVVDTAEAEGIRWPDDETAVHIQSGAHLATYVDVGSEEADQLFMFEVLAGLRDKKKRGFNNLPVILSMLPRRPSEDENRTDYLRKKDSYSIKPYLWRAHMLNPEFMEALQEAVAAKGGTASWSEAMFQGAVEAEDYPHDAALLRASRLGYKLLANLMRSDDRQRQDEWLGHYPVTKAVISDPEQELWA
jgi:hypothetical protein